MEKRFAPLDGLRGIAVLIVLLSHTSGREMYIHESLRFHGIGHVGVYLFFCLSAYLLSLKLFESPLSWDTVRSFFIKRIFRIWPLYYAVILTVYLSQYFFGQYNEKYLFISSGFWGFVQHVFLYRGDSLFWSVVVEEQFYIIVPMLVWLLKRYTRISFAVLTLISVISFVLYLFKNTNFIYHTDIIRYITTNDRDTGNYWDILMSSVLLTFVYYKHKEIRFFKSKLFFALSNILFGLGLLLTLVLVSHQFIIFNEPFRDFRYFSLVYVVLFMPIIISLKHKNYINRLLNNFFLKYLGLYGFSIYLLHFPVLQFINAYVPVGPEVKFMLAFSGVFLVGWASYKFIEKPFIDYSYTLVARLKNKSITS